MAMTARIRSQDGFSHILISEVAMNPSRLFSLASLLFACFLLIAGDGFQSACAQPAPKLEYDLAISSLEVIPSRPNFGEEFTISIGISNQGRDVTPASKLSLTLDGLEFEYEVSKSKPGTTQTFTHKYSSSADRTSSLPSRSADSPYRVAFG